ncbi:hypothetical protein TNCV_5135961 [Trichonephila clavipes]|nr:hypothetical protein TNCV_5135961 [Trichonephila clavipes]
MSRSSGQSEVRLAVFKSPSKLGTHLPTHCKPGKPIQPTPDLSRREAATEIWHETPPPLGNHQLLMMLLGVIGGHPPPCDFFSWSGSNGSRGLIAAGGELLSSPCTSDFELMNVMKWREFFFEGRNFNP